MQRSDSFLHAVQDFKKALPSLRKSLVGHFEAEAGESSAFRNAFAACFEALSLRFREEYQRPNRFGVFAGLAGLEPDFTEEHLSTFLVQHFLLEPLLSWMFPDALADNQIARQVEEVMRMFGNRDWLRMSVDGYFSLIERELRAAQSGAERQHVFNTVCEHFLNGFDPGRAEELGIIYTPPEVVDFMCASCEEQVRQIYGRSLSSANVPILDPCTGTGAFLTNVIGRIEIDSLPYKYANELFGVEIMLMPYHLATLNVEQAFVERCGYYLPFPGMRYADALLS
jgi:predicted helicase